MEHQKYTILIVDDHPIFCYGMTELINKEKDLMVSGSIDNLKEAQKVLRTSPPDMLIVDISLKDGCGLDIIRVSQEIQPKIPTLVLSMYDESLYAERAFLAGAMGYVMKQEAVSSVVRAIQEIRRGNIYASAKIKDKIFKRLISPNASVKGASPLSELTARELEVFRLMGKGYSSKEISEQLHLSIKTIGTHRENIKTKLHIKHYAELIQAAVHWSQKIEL